MTKLQKNGFSRAQLFAAFSVFASIFCMPVSSHAALVDQDWEIGGEIFQYSLIDTSTGLEWLDVRFTYDVSYNTVMNDYLAVGGIYEGFRYATVEEVLHLWSEAGITNTQYVWSEIGEWGAVQGLGVRLGPTILGENPISGGHVLGMVEGGANLPSDQRWALELSYAFDRVSTRTSNEFYTRGVDSANEHYGSYLVRVSTVPVPAAVWLFGSGLIGLIGVARRASRV